MATFSFSGSLCRYRSVLRSIVVLTLFGLFENAAPALFAQPPAAADPPQRPNVVFFLVDDLGWADLGCYGNQYCETPRIDRLAGQGMLFSDAYAACPVCSPTRASLMTGKYPATVGITDFIPGHWRPWARQIVPEIKNQLPLEEQTLGDLFHDGGYRTGYLGKWHLGGREFFPDRQGFELSEVQAGGHFKSSIFTNRVRALPPEKYLAEYLTDRAVEFIRENKDQPFCLYLAHYAVHIPLQAEADKIAKYEQKAGGPDHVPHPTYAAMVEHVDDSVGRVLDVLDELGLAENTIFVFFSDNGGLVRRYDGEGPVVTDNSPLRAEKGTVYEGGIRVPCIVRWPGKVAAGSRCAVPISSVDFLPTLAQAAGLQEKLGPVDGESLLPLLTQTGPLQRDAIFWHYPHYHHMGPAGAIRQGDWKLIEHFEDGRLELYNLADDIGEQHDLASENPEKAKELQARLAEWRAQVGAKLPTENPDFDPERAELWKPRPRPAPKPAQP